MNISQNFFTNTSSKSQVNVDQNIYNTQTIKKIPNSNKLNPEIDNTYKISFDGPPPQPEPLIKLQLQNNMNIQNPKDSNKKDIYSIQYKTVQPSEIQQLQKQQQQQQQQQSYINQQVKSSILYNSPRKISNLLNFSNKKLDSQFQSTSQNISPIESRSNKHKNASMHNYTDYSLDEDSFLDKQFNNISIQQQQQQQQSPYNPKQIVNKIFEQQNKITNRIFDEKPHSIDVALQNKYIHNSKNGYKQSYTSFGFNDQKTTSYQIQKNNGRLSPDILITNKLNNSVTHNNNPINVNNQQTQIQQVAVQEVKQSAQNNMISLLEMQNMQNQKIIQDLREKLEISLQKNNKLVNDIVEVIKEKDWQIQLANNKTQELLELERKLKGSLKSNEDLIQLNKQLHENLMKKQNQQEQYDKTYQDFQMSIQEKSQEIQRLKDGMDTLKNENNELKSKLNQHDITIQQLQENKQKEILEYTQNQQILCQQQISSIKAEADNQIEQFSSQNQELAEKVTLLENENQQLSVQNGELDKQIEILKKNNIEQIQHFDQEKQIFLQKSRIKDEELNNIRFALENKTKETENIKQKISKQIQEEISKIVEPLKEEKINLEQKVNQLINDVQDQQLQEKNKQIELVSRIQEFEQRVFESDKQIQLLINDLEKSKKIVDDQNIETKMWKNKFLISRQEIDQIKMQFEEYKQIMQALRVVQAKFNKKSVELESNLYRNDNSYDDMNYNENQIENNVVQSNLKEINSETNEVINQRENVNNDDDQLSKQYKHSDSEFSFKDGENANNQYQSVQQSQYIQHQQQQQLQQQQLQQFRYVDDIQIQYSQRNENNHLNQNEYNQTMQDVKQLKKLLQQQNERNANN